MFHSLKKVRSGELPLPILFWVYLVGAPLALNIAGRIIAWFADALYHEGGVGTWVSTALYVSLGALGIFMVWFGICTVIGVWRSAKHYEGSGLLVSGVQVIVVGVVTASAVIGLAIGYAMWTGHTAVN